ncbi:hypothetical protein Aperf_G00000037047 [Anoplocephala perfoliata]
MCNSRIILTQETSLRKGQKKRAVLVRAPNRKDLEICLRRIDNTFPLLYACSNLSDATTTVSLVQLKKYCTTEDICLNFESPVLVYYYKLTFNLDSGDMSRYDHWQNTPDALIVKNLGCTLLVSAKDTPGPGFLRRYALISGVSRKNVIVSYEIFRSTFAYLPELNDNEIAQ